MSDKNNGSDQRKNPRSDTISTSGRGCFRMIGTGEIGGKARGLVRLEEILSRDLDRGAYADVAVEIPWFWVVATDWFDMFMEKNKLYHIALSDTKDQHIANAFQRAELPEELVRELKDIIAEVHVPLAVRSSGLLEDALNEPFAGVYGTKMVPNNQFSADGRLRTLVEAIKFVYASTFSRDARSYREAMGRSHDDEKMAVMIQEVVGQRHGDRFYPSLSGVARSHNFYSFGSATPEEGVVSLGLGLGKNIVDGGRSWTYCPAYPKAKPPFGSTKEFLEQTQTQFWSVNMAKPPTFDPIRETEYLFEGNLADAEKDGVLPPMASTYDPQSDRITIGMGSPGPRVLDFAPLLVLNQVPLNDLITHLLKICENDLGNPVEIEFAVDFEPGSVNRGRFGFLQVRPMCVSEDQVVIEEAELCAENVFVASEQVLGNGQLDSIKDVVYVKPDTFSSKNTWLIAGELDEMNRHLIKEGRPYLLVVFGRLGTSDPWLGIPLRWGQVSGAKGIVESSTTTMNVDMSQGSHFFHNVTCLRIFYFSADKTGRFPINWEWLESQQEVRQSQFVRHVALGEPLCVKVDGKSGRGVISH